MAGDMSTSGLTLVLEERIKGMEVALRDSLQRIESAVSELRTQHDEKVRALEERVMAMAIEQAAFRARWGILSAVGAAALSAVVSLVMGLLKGG
jgi:hypothetical protein